MRSISSRLFIGFWLANGLIIVVVYLSYVLVGPEPITTMWKSLLNNISAFYARTATEIFEREGSNELALLLNDLKKSSNIDSYLFNDKGLELSGRNNLNIPVDAKNVASSVIEKNTIEVKLNLTTAIIARPVTGSKGDRYILVALFPRVVGDLMPVSPIRLLFRIILLLLALTIIWYLLSSYLSLPIMRLREVVHIFSNGVITARVSRDLYQRKDEVGDLARDFNFMADKIETLINTQQQLLSDVSHELRSPLSRINVALELARTAQHKEEALDRIELESGRLNTLIEQLLTLNRLSSNIEVPEKEYVDLSRLIREIANDCNYEGAGNKKGVKILRNDPCVLFGSYDLLRSSIENIVRNAIRYTPEGSEVEISLEEKGTDIKQAVILSVRDHGPGVPEEHLDKIFLPFYRIVGDGNRSKEGKGLGLAITKRAIELHNGEIKAQNHSEGGLHIVICLPQHKNQHRGHGGKG
jgi:signal transduction histidine kinase